MNGAEKAFESRRSELRAKLRNDPQAPTTPKWTAEEMQAAAQRVVSAILTTGKLPPRRPVS